MKITHIRIHNILGISRFEVPIEKPVLIVSGPNHSGKSSLLNAVRMGITGIVREAATGKMASKAACKALVHGAEKAGSVSVDTTDGQFDFQIPDKKHSAPLYWIENIGGTDAVRFSIDATLFRRCAMEERRSFILALAGIKMNRQTVLSELASLGVASEVIAKINPRMKETLTPDDFASEEENAKREASEARGEWRGITGEVYGKHKAAEWSAHREPYSKTDLARELAELEEIDRKMEAMQKKLWQIRADEKKHRESMQRADTLRDETKSLRSRVAAMSKDVERLGILEKDADLLRSKAGVKKYPYTCPHCDGGIEVVTTRINPHLTTITLIAFEKGHYDSAAESRLEAVLEKINQLGSVAEEHSQMAALLGKKERLLAELEVETENTLPELPEAKKLEDAIFDLRAGRETREASVACLRRAATENQRAEKDTARARKCYEMAESWTLAAEALAPNGLQAQMVDTALKPINDRLAKTALETGWPFIRINGEMVVIFEGERPCVEPFCSESELWIADACVAEAISKISGTKVLALDRFDVLDVENRSRLFEWTESMVADGDVESVVICGTLKNKPETMPHEQLIWMDN